jgi:hypothetical protein
MSIVNISIHCNLFHILWFAKFKEGLHLKKIAKLFAKFGCFLNIEYVLYFTFLGLFGYSSRLIE